MDKVICLLMILVISSAPFSLAREDSSGNGDVDTVYISHLPCNYSLVSS